MEMNDCGLYVCINDIFAKNEFRMFTAGCTPRFLSTFGNEKKRKVKVIGIGRNGKRKGNKRKDD
jgi:hypothetical protein